MYIYILLFGWVEFEIILNLEDEKYIRFSKDEKYQALRWYCTLLSNLFTYQPSEYAFFLQICVKMLPSNFSNICTRTSAYQRRSYPAKGKPCFYKIYKRK